MSEESSGPEIDPGIFRRVLGRFGTGVTVLTTQGADGVHGMTANAFMSGSLHPPLVVVSVGQRTKFHDLVMASGRMGISVLAADQADHSRLFAGQLRDRIAPPFEFRQQIPVVAEAGGAGPSPGQGIPSPTHRTSVPTSESESLPSGGIFGSSR